MPSAVILEDNRLSESPLDSTGVKRLDVLVALCCVAVVRLLRYHTMIKLRWEAYLRAHIVVQSVNNSPLAYEFIHPISSFEASHLIIRHSTSLFHD